MNVAGWELCLNNARHCRYSDVSPDGGWKYHPEHVEHFADINKLYIVASCWVIINAYYAMHGPLIIKWSKIVITIIPEVMKVNQKWTNLHSLKQKSGNIGSCTCVSLFVIFLNYYHT